MRIATIHLVISFAFLVSCGKDEREIYGDITVSGKVTDIISKTTLAGCPVMLVGYKNIRGTDSTVVLAKDTTDVDGNYTMSATASGESLLQVDALAPSNLYLSSTDLFNLSTPIIKPGTFTRDIDLQRSSFLKVNVINAPPINTVDSLFLFSLYSRIVLRNFSKDSIVYLKLNGDPLFNNPVGLSHGFQHLPGDTQFNIKVNGWDTVTVQYKY